VLLVQGGNVISRSFNLWSTIIWHHIAMPDEHPLASPSAPRGPEALTLRQADQAKGTFACLREAGLAGQGYDLVVFDEAHKLSADRDPIDMTVRKTARYKVAEALAGIVSEDPDFDLGWAPQSLMLLTATPHMIRLGWAHQLLARQQHRGEPERVGEEGMKLPDRLPPYADAVAADAIGPDRRDPMLSRRWSRTHAG